MECVHEFLGEERDSGLTRLNRHESAEELAGSQSAVEPAETAGEHDRCEEYACAECEDVSGVEQVEAADAADEQVGDREVAEDPEDVDRTSGQIGRASGRGSVW